MEWIYFVALFFWIVSAINKAKKKQLLEAQKKTMQRATDSPSLRELPKLATPAKTYRMATEAEMFAMFQERINEVRTIDEPVLDQSALDYDQISSFDTSNDENNQYRSEHSYESHFKTAHGIQTSLSDMSRMPKGKEAVRPVNFSVYSRKKFVASKYIEMTPAALRKYFIASEIFGKPKALRK
jgi:hypothetical protein